MSDSKTPTRIRRLLLSRRWLVLPPMLIGVAVIVGLVTNRKELDRVDERKEEANAVRVVEAVRGEIAATATGYGTVRAKRVWSAVAEVGGRVVELHQPLRSGIFVSKDSLLAKIDRTDYDLLRKQRDAELRQALAERLQLDVSEKADRESLAIQTDLQAVRDAEVKRLKKLSGSSAASVSELDASLALYLTQAQAVQNLKTALSLYEPQKLAADARVASAESRLAEVDRDLQRTEIRAALDGVLSQVSLEVGQYVSPMQVLFNVLEVSTVEIEAQFSLAQLIELVSPAALSAQRGEDGTTSNAPALASRLTARVIVRSGDAAIEYSGLPIRVADQVDSQTRTLGIVVEVDNPGFRAHGSAAGTATIPLRPGTFCEVILESKHPVGGVLIDRTAVDAGSVFVVDKQNRMRRRSVETRKLTGPQGHDSQWIDRGRLSRC